MTNYGASAGSVIGAGMVFGAVSQLTPKKKKKKKKGDRK